MWLEGQIFDCWNKRENIFVSSLDEKKKEQEMLLANSVPFRQGDPSLFFWGSHKFILGLHNLTFNRQ